MDGGAAGLAVDAGADALRDRDNSGRSAPATIGEDCIRGSEPASSRGDTLVGGDTFSGRTGATCRSARGPGIGRYRFRFGRDIRCARLAGGDRRRLSRRRRCAVAPTAYRPRAHLASDPQSAAGVGPLGRRRGRSGERCRRHAGDLLDVASNVQRAPTGVAMARVRTVRRRVERILAATAVPTSMGWRRRAMIAITLIPLVAVSAVTIARSTPALPRAGMIVPAGSPMQPISLADAQTMPSAAGNQAAADATALDRYVGYYQLNPRAVFTITRTDDQLFAQVTGQRVLPLRPAGNGEYVYGSAALRMSFVSDGQGTMLVVRQQGKKLVSARVDRS